MRRRALVSQTRMPELDRDRGSQRVDTIIRWLLDDGWSVTFIAEEETADEWHARRLRQLGVATFAGYSRAAEVVAPGAFDLAVLAFWQPASQLLPVIRARSPETRVVVDSIDVHFLRDARRQLGIEGQLDSAYGAQLIGELNTYQAADAVLTVSTKEAELLDDFLGPGRAHCLPLTESLFRSTIPFEERSGSLFVGNFRHLPNGEAVEYLCRDVLPRVDPELLAEHPLTVVGNRLGETVRGHAAGLPAVQMVGWVPSVEPYFEHSRVCVVPLLHGAGVKGKVIQALMLGTPVVTTTIGAEGLDLTHDEHALIADTPGDLAAGISRLLTDRDTWRRLSDAGYAHARASHGCEAVRERFLSIVAGVLERPTVGLAASEEFRHGRRRMLAYRDTQTAVQETVRLVTDPGSVVLVVSKGDEDLLGFEGRTGWHFPRSPDGEWAGYHPADSESAIRHLEALRDRGAEYLVLPNIAFWWLHHYRDLVAHLDDRHRRIHSDEHAVVFDLSDRHSREHAPAIMDAAHRERVLVVGTYGDERPGPPSSLAAELDKSRRFTVTQRWQRSGGRAEPTEVDPTATDGADWLLFVDDAAVLPPGFVDDFLTLQAGLAVERAQPAHTGGPEAGPPVTERIEGCTARHVSQVTPLPVLAVRAPAALSGPVALVDAVPIGLARPLVTDRDPLSYSRVLDVVVPGSEGAVGGVRRSAGSVAPRISVLIATYDRPDLLAGCLEAFCEQTLDRSDYEVVVVDDGSSTKDTAAVLDRFAARLPLVSVRIEHAGRSAAKNVAVLLARGDLVLFFDDDDRPAADLLDEHLRAHEADPDEGVAILGYTDWAPELAVTPLMHYLTEVDKLLFAYGNLHEGQTLDWRGFWEGRISCKRSLLVRHGLHDQRLAYSIDVETARRLGRYGLKVIYRSAARSYMARGIDFDGFCRRIEAKGRAQALIASLHGDDEEVRRYAKIDGARSRWEEARDALASTVARVHELEAQVVGAADETDPRLTDLHRCYREAFDAFYAKGVCGAGDGEFDPGAKSAAVAEAPDEPVAPSVSSATVVHERPELTVTMPVWSRTAELAEMAVGTVDRIWEVARVRTEVIVVDNGSPHQRPLAATVHRFEENRGVATAWNTGIEMARAPVVAVLNSDCLVEPGWDEALLEAATHGRRIAFPYTDHGDGLGFRQPDQAGTAGWCFALAQDVYRDIGPFDELFNPAYCEDTDYWHRAWELGVELSPVPAARVTHSRRTTACTDPHVDWLLQGHRFLYGWKHGVDPLRAPPYYNRAIVEYHCRGNAGVVTS